MDRLTSMTVFSRVLELRSFSGAARALDISQATVSKHVQTLEDWLGIQLLTRTTRRVIPTPEGEGFYTRCQRILNEIKDIRSAGDGGPLLGHIRLACTWGIASIYVGTALGRLLAAQPGLSADVVLTDPSPDLVAGGFDAFITLADNPPAGMIKHRLAEIPLVLCAAPEYLARRGRPLRPQDLADHDCLSGTTPEHSMWRFQTSGEQGAAEITVSIKGRLASRSAIMLRDAAVGGGGILLIPPRMADVELVSGRLLPLLQDFPPVPLALNAYFTPDRQLSGRLQAMLDILSENLASLGV